VIPVGEMADGSRIWSSGTSTTSAQQEWLASSHKVVGILVDSTRPSGASIAKRVSRTGGGLIVSAAFLLTGPMPTGVAVDTAEALGAAVAQHTVGQVQYVRSTSRRTSESLARDAEAEQRAATPAELVTLLKNRSGLTWEQVGRFLGVSRRAVHQWATGARVTARHHEVLSDAVGLLDELRIEDPTAVRATLLAPRPGRESIFDEFRRRHRHFDDISGTPGDMNVFKIGLPDNP
jgi:hypothetical protein